MLNRTSSRRRCAALVSACLLSVSLPATAAWAQKTKTKGVEAPTSQSAGTAMSSEFSVDIPGIESIGSNVDDSVIRDILSGHLVENADALAGLTANSITVPEITIDASSTVDGETMEASITLADLVLSDVEKGIAGSVTIGGFSIDSDEGSAEFGAMSASSFDIGGVLGMYGLVTGTGDQNLKTIYTDFNFEGGTVTSPEASCNIGTMTAAEFKARPLNFSFAEIMALEESLNTEDGEPSPEVVGKAMRMYVDILTAFETSPLEFGGFDCTGVDDQDRPIDFSIAGMTVGGMSPGLYPELTLDGLDIQVEGDGTVSVGSAVFKSMDLSSPIAAIQNAPEAIDPAWFEANARALIPAFGGFTINDVAIDVPDSENPDTRIIASVGSFDLSLDQYFNGIPTDISTKATNIIVDIPADTTDENLAQLASFGITTIDAGFALDASWNEAENTISIDEISVNGANLASIVLAGTIANATEALFATDENEMMAAAMGVAVADLRLDVTDAGLSDIILARAAADQGSDAATMRPVFAGLAEGTIVGMLAGAADAQKVGGAVSAFVSGKAKQLIISIAAKEAPGLGMMDFMAAQENPALLLGKVTIDASAK